MAVNGREVLAAYGSTSTWGIAASVTQQIHLQTTEGLDGEIQLVDDEAFNQEWLEVAEAGDHTPRTPSIAMQGRFEYLDQWFAAGLGSPATPTYVSSQGDPTSLVAASHVINLAPALTHMFSLAVDIGRPSHHVLEIPSFKVRGFTFRIGENGRIMVEFPIVGAKAVYDSTTNINSTVHGATAATLGNRLFRKNMRVRLNVQSDGALGSGDEQTAWTAPVTDFTLDMTRPLADGDYAANSDFIIEPDDNGFAEIPGQITFGRMNTRTANSLIQHLNASTGVLKGDIRWLGPYINSTTQRSMLLEMPALQIYRWQGVVTGHEQVKPILDFRLKRAATSPTGMDFVNPLRMTLINANSVPLLS